MQRHRFALLFVAAVLGIVAGFPLGWITVGLVLIGEGRGGHADLPIVFAAGAVGALMCSVAAVIATARWIRRRPPSTRAE